ncbi:MAG TPA: hypothetical protein DDW76_03980 [Cyanobacteria bacterium UBA11369]|nr:hypothetical protein [Cyanobacteria bacterium UBA11371]HBE32517.1 hypothetical protein [Cyanobacteria bacterium UBA11368]HBE47971.1 hypothetical protein [Cyanobacteria bacterium UBA11369]
MTQNTYKASLFSWAIFRFVNCKPIVVGRFRSRSDAEGHLQVLRRLIPGVEFAIAFIPPESIDSVAVGTRHL